MRVGRGSCESAKGPSLRIEPELERLAGGPKLGREGGSVGGGVDGLRRGGPNWWVIGGVWWVREGGGSCEFIRDSQRGEDREGGCGGWGRGGGVGRMGGRMCERREGGCAGAVPGDVGEK